jgi:hypothetical protein
MRTRRFPTPLTTVFRARRSSGRVRWHRMVTAVLLVSSGACGKTDLKSELDRVRSWTSTTQLASERSATGAINRAVAVQLVDRATEAHAESRRSLAQLAATETERTSANALLDSLRVGIGRLQAVAR